MPEEKKKKKNPDEVKMSLGDHLEELRFRLMLGMIGPFILFFGTMPFGDRIMTWLFRPALMALKLSGQTIELVDTKGGGAFSLYLQVCFITAMVFGIPWLFYQLWKFIAPGLYGHERKIIHAIIPGSAALAIAGVLFMYYAMLPFLFFFLFSFPATIQMPDLTPNIIEKTLIEKHDLPPATEANRPTLKIPVVADDPADHKVGDVWVKTPENELRVDMGNAVLRSPLSEPHAVKNLPDIGAIMELIVTMALAFAVAFQTPLVLFILGWIGIFDHKQLASVRSYAFLACVIIGAVLTPGGDPISMTVLALPTYLLYEAGILLVWRFGRKKPSKETAADA